jgi:hypothetical protein
MKFTKRETWERWYSDLPIPERWTNISYRYDELPSFKTPTGYQVWISSPDPKTRRANASGLLKSDPTPARFAVMYITELDCELFDEPTCFCSDSFEEVLNHVSNEEK